MQPERERFLFVWSIAVPVLLLWLLWLLGLRNDPRLRRFLDSVRDDFSVELGVRETVVFSDIAEARVIGPAFLAEVFYFHFISLV
jgi:hypothetical protein